MSAHLLTYLLTYLPTYLPTYHPTYLPTTYLLTCLTYLTYLTYLTLAESAAVSAHANGCPPRGPTRRVRSRYVHAYAQSPVHAHAYTRLPTPWPYAAGALEVRACMRPCIRNICNVHISCACNVHNHLDMQYAHAPCTCTMHMHYAHALCTCTMHMHAAACMRMDG